MTTVFKYRREHKDMSKYRKKDEFHTMEVRGHLATMAAGTHQGCKGKLEENLVRRVPKSMVPRESGKPKPRLEAHTPH